MRTLFSLKVGDLVSVDLTLLRLDAMIPTGQGLPQEPDDFQFKDDRFGRAILYTEEEFLALYSSGRVKRLSPTGQVTGNIPLSESTEPDDIVGDARALKAVQTGRRRLHYKKAFTLTTISLSTPDLNELIAFTAQQIGDSAPPSAGSLRRWIKRGSTLGVMMGRHAKGPKGSRLQPRVQEILTEEAERYYDSVRVASRDIWDLVTNRINEENESCLEISEKLVRPARSTVWRWLKDSLTYERVKRRWGPKEAERRFGIIAGSMSADALLDLAIIDHTILDCWIIDDRTFQPIGRPRLTFVTEVLSRQVLGFNLGWANAGLDAALAAIRHAVRPKTYVKTDYPDIPYEWTAYGQPRTLVVDQGLEFMGTTFEDVCASLGMNLEPAPCRTPEYKGQIERFIQTHNKGLLRKLPGSVPYNPQLLRDFNIDPEKTAILFLTDAIELIHRWIITVYSREVHSSLGMAPAKKWAERAKTDIIELCPNIEELDRVCARTSVVRLTREGIKMHGSLVYRCPELSCLRESVSRSAKQKARTKQGSVSVKVTWHENDLSKINAWNPETNSSLEVPCINQVYTRGLSLQLHKQVSAFRRDENEEFHSEAEMVANRTAIYHLMENICERRVLDRKRLQKVRTPERRAQGSLVKLESVDTNGRVMEENVVEVAVDPHASRDLLAPREPRSLLNPRVKKPSRIKVFKAPAAEGYVVAGAESAEEDIVDWAKEIEKARTQNK